MDLAQFLGRFHVLLLHLPLGILVMAACIEVFNVFKQKPRSELLKTVWLWGAVTAVGAALLGYLLSLGGGYNPEAVAIHRNWAISVIVCAFLCWHYLPKVAGKKIKVTVLSVVQLLLLFSTGHYGANMTHGETYLVEHAPDFVQKWVGLEAASGKPNSVAEALIYPHIIEPMLKQRCSGCHNDSKSKGDLSFASYETTLIHSVTPNALSESELYKRVTLPEYHEDFMPAEGKTPLTESQVSILAWWIEHGAQNEVLVSELNPDAAALSLLGEALGVDKKPVEDRVAEVDSALVAELEQLGFLVSRVYQDGPFVSVIYADIHQPLTEEKFDKLLQLREQLMWLKLSKSSLSDAQLEKLSTAKKLSKLDISHTQVDLKSVDVLRAEMPSLSINAYNVGTR